MIEKSILKKGLINYGVPEIYHNRVLSGKVVNVPFGKIKLDKNKGTLKISTSNEIKNVNIVQ